MTSETNKQNIHGILLLDKSLGLTSNHALQRVKRLFCAKKAGHTGSLDPLATGMLPICFGEATKFSQFLLEADKKYRVTLQLGMKTTTGDAEGEVISTRVVPEITPEKIATLSEKFKGTLSQIPPMYSALKHQGKPLYHLARQGIEVERAARTVHIYDLHCEKFTETTLDFVVHCSKGTYIRTLVEDMGEYLECGAHVISLHRLSVTPYQQAPMYSFSELETLSQKGLPALHELLLPVETSLQKLPAVRLNASSAFYLRQGQPVTILHYDPGLVRLFVENHFIGIGEVTNDGRVAPRRLVSQ